MTTKAKKDDHKTEDRHAAVERELAHPKTEPQEHTNAAKDPHTWTTGGESMTGAQASYLQTLCEEAGIEFDPKLTKAEASLKIDELKGKTGRGIDH